MILDVFYYIGLISASIILVGLILTFVSSIVWLFLRAEKRKKFWKFFKISLYILGCGVLALGLGYIVASIYDFIV
ncbi:MAG: hypothetical protein WCW30_00305, partial [Candidatus Gracilibacteria bacterium]